MALAAVLLLALQAAVLQTSDFRPQTSEIVSAVSVHGNILTPEAEILRIADIPVGQPLSPTAIADATARLERAHLFKHVEVLKRFASIEDTSKVLIVLIVDEGPARIEATGDPDRPVRVVRSRRPPLMAMPILAVEDGYGLQYGARLAVPSIAGKGSRLSFPLTWGGNKGAAAELSRTFAGGPVTFVEAGASVSRRTNPFFHEDDDRGRVWTRVEKRLPPSLTIGGGAEWQSVSFANLEDRFTEVSGDVVFDTRRDPVLPRNAVYARAAYSRLMLPSGAVNRHSLGGRAYLGVYGQTVLVAGVRHEGADASLPPYLQPLLGGLSNLRGFRAGTASGDNLLATSLELRMPLTSPLRVGKFGVTAFIDSAGVYDAASRIGDVHLKTGIGAEVWFAAAFLHANVAVAHGIGGSTRVHVGTSLTF